MSEFESGTERVEARLRFHGENHAIRWFPKATSILGAILLTAGACIALLRPVMLASPHDEINGAVHIYAGYLASRNFSLAIALLMASFWPRLRCLGPWPPPLRRNRPRHRSGRALVAAQWRPAGYAVGEHRHDRDSHRRAADLAAKASRTRPGARLGTGRVKALARTTSATSASAASSPLMC